MAEWNNDWPGDWKRSSSSSSAASESLCDLEQVASALTNAKITGIRPIYL